MKNKPKLGGKKKVYIWYRGALWGKKKSSIMNNK